MYWRYEAESTQRMMDALTDESLQQAVTAQDRTLGRMAWHIVATIPEMLERTGLSLEVNIDESTVPASARQIADGYRQAAEALAAAVERHWSDANLQEEKELYPGERWTNGFTLGVLIRHQSHHRGQMTVLMRQAGLTVPGVYGPSREEWSGYGMEAPSV
nr:DinB family protein [Heliomicrobium undosum]